MRAAAWRYWIFDLDGTLTRPVHDFEAIRAELGLPTGAPILEALDALPPELARARREHLDRIELEIARRAEPAAGARLLLESLRERGARLGIVTRNGAQNTRETLRAAGLFDLFEPQALISREHAAPKPRPDGIASLLDYWGAPAGAAVMVGDFLYDLVAGRAAGVATIYVDPSGRFPHREHADHVAQDLRIVRNWLES